MNPGPNNVLIQIVDPGTEFPTPRYKFDKVHQFYFLDVENENDIGWECKMPDEDAIAILNILEDALKNKSSVIVHCHAGLCRSGAVAEIGIIMGFADTDTLRIPNSYMKRRFMQLRGLTYN